MRSNTFLHTHRNTHLRTLSASFAFALAVAACSSGGDGKPGAIDPPETGALKPLTIPAMTERTLPNGMHLVVIPHTELPVIDATLVIRAGSEADPAGKAGLATLTADLLDEGAGTLDALGIADQTDYLAVRLRTGAGFDMSQISLHATRAVLDSAFALMADVALRPTFAEKEFARLKAERLTSLLQEQDRGPAIADRVFAAIVYGTGHPYGRSTAGTRETISSVTRADAVAFWQKWYQPANATLVIAGDIQPDEAEALAVSVFGAWTGSAAQAVSIPAAPAPSATTIYIVDKPGAPQSSFRIGSVGAARSTPDYYPIQVMNTALGGSFTSRLNQNLRETKGYTYGASSGFTMRRESGPFTARAEVVREKSDSALIEFMAELNNIRDSVPADEVERTKSFLTLGYAGRFETPSQIASQVANLVPFGLPPSTLGEFESGINGVTDANVKRVAARYIDPTKLAIVIVGDRAAIEAPIRALGIAPVEIRDIQGRPVARGN